MASVWIRRSGSRWRVCWREPVLDERGVPLRCEDGRAQTTSKSRTVSSKESARVLSAEVTQALERGGAPQAAAPAPPPAVAAPSCDDLAAAYLRHRAARGAARASLEVWYHQLARISRFCTADGLRDVSGWRIATVTRALTAWRAEGLGDARLYEVCRTWLAVWAWAADQPETYAVPVPPRDRALVLPRPPRRSHATLAPSWAECDAVVRELEDPALRDLAVVLRCTGLRRAQVLALEVPDLERDELGELALRIRVGKGAAETAAARLVPLALDAADALCRRRDAVGSGPLWPALDRDEATRSPQAVSAAIARAWQRATDAGAVRPSVWQPQSHGKARPCHGFRAAFAAGLASAAVADPVIEALLGHAGGSTLRRHYASLEHTTYPAQRAAVRAIPPVDFGVVVPFGVGLHG